MDKELQILSLIGEESSPTQRILSERMGISVGNVNILIRKMIREGYVKITKMPSNRIAYMLTPRGLQEKFDKTIAYVSIHYKAISDMKRTLKTFFTISIDRPASVRASIQRPEINEIIREVIKEISSETGIDINYSEDVDSNDDGLISIYFDSELAQRTFLFKILGSGFNSYR